jgi:hypothetical protein
VRLALLLALLCLPACRPGQRKGSPSVVKKPVLTKPLTEEDRAELDRSYYLAVQHYMEGRYEESSNLIKLILKRDPANQPALKLRERVRAAQKLQ